MSTDRKEETHPAYGVVGFYRQTGGGRKLFGSHTRPSTTVVLKISKAASYHDLGQDWNMSKGQPIIEITLSPAQFAQLLTTMNVGDGVPCTISRLNNERVPEIPDDTKNETTKIHDSFKESMVKVGERLNTLEQRAESLLAGRLKPTKANLDLLHKEVLMTMQDVKSNFPFMLEQFTKSAHKVVTQVKAEVDAFVTHAVQVTGLKAIKSGLIPQLFDDSKPPEETE